MSGSSPPVGRGAFARSCLRCSRLCSLSRCRSCRFFSFWRFAGVVGMDGRPPKTSDGRYVFRPRALGTHALGERDTLTLPEFLEPHALDGGHVKEDVFAGARLDEAEAFVRESLDGAFGHDVAFRCLGGGSDPSTGLRGARCYGLQALAFSRFFSLFLPLSIRSGSQH